MKKKNLSAIAAISTGGFFLLLDQALKYIARSHELFSYYIVNPWLGWEYLENFGIAFGIPITQYIVIPVSFIIIGGLFIYTAHNQKRSTLLTFATAIIISGALSNIIDRMFFGFTTDYFRIINSVINLADVFIVVGALMLILSEYKDKQS